MAHALPLMLPGTERFLLPGLGRCSGLNRSLGAVGGEGGWSFIIIFNRLLVEQQSFSLVLANEELLAGFQREAGPRDTSASVILSASQGCFYLESREQHQK